MSIDKIINSTNYVEDSTVLKLFSELSGIKKRGYLQKDEFLSIARTKSSRPLKHYSSNSSKQIKEATGLSFSVKNDSLKLHILTSLTGVGYPMASTVLMFYDRAKFPIIDIRVWKVLHKSKIVTVNQRGQNFTLQQCLDYYDIIRTLARNHNCTAREVEKRLFDYSVLTQKGRLYL